MLNLSLAFTDHRLEGEIQSMANAVLDQRKWVLAKIVLFEKFRRREESKPNSTQSFL
jgi:hypothetical protein